MSDPLGATPGLELFESYEQDYEQLSDSISKLLAADVSRQSLGRVERELDEADEIVRLRTPRSRAYELTAL